MSAEDECNPMVAQKDCVEHGAPGLWRAGVFILGRT
jgi:hypothetical protein